MLKSFWDEQHEKQNIRRLSDYPGEKIWRYLEIKPCVIKNNTVLNIGLGTGRCTKDLHDKGMKVYGLDISQLILDKVKHITVDRWLNTEYEKVPSDMFDLAICHLVVQHMDDDELETMLTNVIRVLKGDGVFAVQFASPLLGTNYIPDFHHLSSGGVMRTQEHMEKLVNEAGGNVVRKCRTLTYSGCFWNGFHITKTQLTEQNYG